ncbi:MAG: transglycosylase domain-containing protein [Oligoflexus sp.]|nr:transglycosylase domain-containing protein [Oligoflexus sp.]
MQRKRILQALSLFLGVSFLSCTFIVVPLLQDKAKTKIAEWVKHSAINLTFQEVKLLWNGIRIVKLHVARGEDRLKSDVDVTFGLSGTSPFLKPTLVTFVKPKILIYRNIGQAKTEQKAAFPAEISDAHQSLTDLLDRYFTAGVSVALKRANIQVFDSKREPLISIPSLDVQLNAKDRTAQIDSKNFSFKETKLLSEVSGQILLQKQREFYPFLLQARDPNGEPWQLKGQISHDFETIDIRHKRKGVPSAWLPKLTVIGNPDEVRFLVRLKLDGLMSRDQVNYDIKVASNNLYLQHESLGKTPFGPWPFSVRSRGVLTPETASLNVGQGEFFLISRNKGEAVHLSFTGSKKNLQSPMKVDPFEFNFHMQNSSCQAALDAVPQNLLPSLEGLELEGSFALDGTLKLISQDDIVYFTPKLNHIDCRITTSPEYLQRQWLFSGKGPVPEFLADNPSIRALKSGHPTPRNLIPDDFFKALVAAEDAKFWRHDGILIPSLVAALQANLKAGHVVFGGSTITMQLAKNLFLDRDRVISRKIQEIAIAWVLEQNLSKAEILELYANVVEFAPETYGIGKAAALYFKKPVNEMTTAESLFLASILPSPTKNFSESYCHARLSPRLSHRMQMVASGLNSLSQERGFMKVYETDLKDFQFSSALKGCETLDRIGVTKQTGKARL